MRVLRSVATALLALSIFLTGCIAVGGGGRNITIRVAGAPKFKYECRYQFGTISGSVSTATTGRNDTILDVSAGPGFCEFSKDASAGELAIAIFEGKRERFTATMPAGVSSLRVLKDSSGWRSERVGDAKGMVPGP